MVLIYIFLMISFTEHLFIYLLFLYMSSLEKCLFRCSAYFLIGLFGGVFFFIYIYVVYYLLDLG